MARGADQQRVGIALVLVGDELGAHLAACAGLVDHDKGLLEGGLQLFGQQAAGDVGGATGRKADDDVDRLGGPGGGVFGRLRG